MRVLKSLLSASIIALSATNAFAASWTFADATVSVQSKGTGVGGGRKDK
jgi:oligosaccharyltransferase complex subunit delta (ribophorin II)